MQKLANKLDGTTLPLFEQVSRKGQANGYPSLDANGHIPTAQLQALAIPGEIKMWSGIALPTVAKYGTWVWADGTAYAAATYPEAAANIAAGWKTHNGKADPGAGMFRVPDLRGSAPIGLDAMPGGARANRMSRAAAINVAGVAGEEYHILNTNEMPAHAHGVNDPGHSHSMEAQSGTAGGAQAFAKLENWIAAWYTFISTNPTGISIQNAGGGAQHENVPPTTFVPYIVKLDN
jgi:microcystin-dependent protein